jgi:hypothetical protein
VGLLAFALSAVPFATRSERLRAIIREGQNAAGQVMLRWSVVLLFALLFAAAERVPRTRHPADGLMPWHR